ncbi:homoserine dehydrogenase [Virgibacillus pantothenticus]|uniref:Homoserine dehydrogenase n=1 Tax=Virgibacillus pantothenticus TaxID=1473 RepID=A0A0L0QKB6_VIRPA|nr:homoserine dehydrogenase [Virgibacillus pantothenticus]KNE18969.1 homoserine dehydrogenase [Virgibacillus pantothenticus]MED3736450.1 homoserine dehydrogenase [Virgibacillus pantothenticus]QTY15396.1 homoserine dehydrogenase [Virgibacillus pantothenticus]SIS81777.1 homoserine dehydrogenase [Virgibacillus pantothenticus]GIP63450.1 homoserine dehydrogenase [Virgibacillus pantothenticus]
MGNKVSIGLLGLGVVGSGVIKLIKNHQEELVHQLGCSIEVKSVLVRNVDKVRDVDLNQTFLTTDPADILQDPAIDVIIEVMGGIDEAYQYTLEAFRTKKHVVSANKDLIALHGTELEETARQHKCDFYYEASVAGGIPILRGITDGLASDRIQKVMGIVNGTTNYILTKMTNDGMTYEEALKEAQELGFAEADPTADVEGLDAARKMAILGRLAFSTDVALSEVEVNGIKDLELADLQYGEKFGYTMKLIGFAQCKNQQIEVSVQPTFLSNDHPLAGVKNEYNAVYVYGDAVGETMFYGPGAGSLPTATAIVSDLVTVIKNMRLGISGNASLEPRITTTLRNSEQRSGQYYLRIHVKDRIGAFSEISTLFNDLSISFKRILQTPMKQNGLAEIILITHQTSLATFENALNQLHELDVVKQIKSYYKVEGDAPDELAGTAKTLS